jgi:predicted AlkP superfamily phosphohydrolase/phosphomutase
MTLPAWSTVLTGVNPGVHGILDFTRRIPGSYRIELLNATHRRVPTFLELLSDAGGRVASLFVPTTFPPSRLGGLVVSGFDSPAATAVGAAHVHPRARHATLVRRFGALSFAALPEGRVGPGWHDAASAALLREIGRKEALCDALLREERWDAFMVVFGESDTAAHHFWMFHDRCSPRHRPGHEHVLAAVYRRLDAALGRLAGHADLVCVASDHGFGGASDRVVYLNRFLEAAGWLRFAGASSGAERVRQAALGLPVGGVVRRIPPRILAAVEGHVRHGAIDFRATGAWSEELSYAPSIHLNLRGRDPLGVVADRAAAVRELSERLLAWRIDGERVVARVVPREEAISGPAAAGAPDLYLDLAQPDGYSLTALPSARVAPGVLGRRLEPAEWAGGKGLGMNGTHRPDGVLGLAGPPFRPGRVAAGVADVMPTLLAALGVTPPVHVEGRVLREAFQATPSSPRTPPSPPSPAPPRPYDAAEARSLRARLDALGYT